jgi:lantibiotic modifying enzyme
LEKDKENGLYDRPHADVSKEIFSEVCRYVLQSSANRRQIQDAAAADLNLYHGASGLAMYFAAYYRASRDLQARQIALETIAPVHSWIEWQAGNRHEAQMGKFALGGLIGFASCLYGLTNIADWLNAPELLDTASLLAGMIHPQQIFADYWLDVMNGSAGTLLALLAFLQVSRNRGMNPQFALDLAEMCGRHLLQARSPTASAPRGWPGLDGIALPGFAHGASGISYALSRLYHETKDEAFSDGALEGFAFERTLYVPEQQGWLDPRSNQIMERSSWCDGAPGIALGRLGAVRYMDDPALRSDIDNALKITRALPEPANDQLCCGSFSHIDVLHTAGTLLDRLHLSEHAREMARRAVERSSGNNFHLSHQAHPTKTPQTDQTIPSLFLGLPGVGYTLLRLRYPRLLPSVLMLEPTE